MNTKIGTQVRVNGEWGTITEVHDGQLTGMIDVRLPSGSVTVPESEVVRRFTPAPGGGVFADGYGTWHVLVEDHKKAGTLTSVDWANMIRLARTAIAIALLQRGERGRTFSDVLNLVAVERRETTLPYTYEFVEYDQREVRS